MTTNFAQKPVFAALAAMTLATCGITSATMAAAEPDADGPDCPKGFTWRLATPDDHVCVTTEHFSLAQLQNSLAAQNREPNGGPYGPDTCKQGYVWREAVPGDHVCVPPEGRDTAALDNKRRVALPNAPVPAPAGDSSGAVLSLINQQRAQNGCAPVASNPQLAAAAARHANDMLTNGITGHDGSDGSSPSGRISDAGYAPMGKWGEIVYRGSGSDATPQAAVNWWMNSPTHRAIVTSCDFKDVGVSAVSANGTMTSTADFGSH